MVAGGGNGKLVGQIFCVLGCVGDAGYMGGEYQARAEQRYVVQIEPKDDLDLSKMS